VSPHVPALAVALAIAGCSDGDAPSGPPRDASAPTAAQIFERYVALGTSNSMGVQSAGIFAEGQRAAWTSQLASRVGVQFSMPLVQDPGCGPPLVAPLANNLTSIGDAVGAAARGTCAPLRSGITLPTNSVAISGANVHDALVETPERAFARSARTGALYSRVLAPGQTQVTAMLAQKPTFVSVELAANDVLPASTGRVSAMTPYAEWERDYDAVIAAVSSTGARAVLVGVPNDAAAFPSVRRAREFSDEASALAGLGVRVTADCARSSNYLYVPGYLLTLAANAPATATCADIPGAADYVLTADDVAAINAQMARMNAHIQATAAEHGFAYFGFDAVYGLAKPKFSVADLFFSKTPFGPNMSLDGVHPSAAGQGLLATAAAKAINATYGTAIR
jgi:lysophospholipase L1-like esterase